MQEEADKQNQKPESKLTERSKSQSKSKKSRRKDWKPLEHVRDSFAEQIWQDHEPFDRH